MPESTTGSTPSMVAWLGARGQVWQWLLLGVGVLLVFGVFNLSVLGKERLLERGTVVRLALAPRDPRAFLTGDYMALNYQLSNELRGLLARAGPRAASAASAPSSSSSSSSSSSASASSTTAAEAAAESGTEAAPVDDYAGLPADAYLIVTLDARQVARLVRLQSSAKPVTQGELALRYRYRSGRVQVGSNAFYFEEGSAGRYEPARFGEFRVDANGTMLLVHLLDEQLRPL